MNSFHQWVLGLGLSPETASAVSTLELAALMPGIRVGQIYRGVRHGWRVIVQCQGTLAAMHWHPHTEPEDHPGARYGSRSREGIQRLIDDGEYILYSETPTKEMFRATE